MLPDLTESVASKRCAVGIGEQELIVAELEDANVLAHCQDQELRQRNRRFSVDVTSAPIPLSSNSIMPTAKGYLAGKQQGLQTVRVRAWEQESHERKGTPATDFAGDIWVSVSSPPVTVRLGPDGQPVIQTLESE